MPDSIVVLSECSAVWYKVEKTGIFDSKFYDNHQVLRNIVMLVTEV